MQKVKAGLGQCQYNNNTYKRTVTGCCVNINCLIIRNGTILHSNNSLNANTNVLPTTDKHVYYRDTGTHNKFIFLMYSHSEARVAFASTGTLCNWTFGLLKPCFFFLSETKQL